MADILADAPRVENPTQRVSDDDIRAVASRIEGAAYSLLAIRRLAIDADNDDTGMYLLAIKDLARSAFKGLDACIQRLHDGPGMGNFEGEFGEG